MKKTFNIGYYERIRPNHVHPLVEARRRYLLFPNDNAVTSSLIQGWIYEPYMFKFISDNLIDLTGTHIADIGANNGHFTIEFAHYVGDDGMVFSFEPQRVIFQQLCGNVFINGLDNVQCYNMAVGNEESIIFVEKPDYFSNDAINFGDVHTNKHNNYLLSDKVQQIKLDDIEFKNLSIIKIDVQGFEPFVIEGAINTINLHRPYIFVEIEGEQLEKFGYGEQELIKQIEDLNYVVKRFQVGIKYQTKSGICLDCVCIPKEKYDKENYIVR